MHAKICEQYVAALSPPELLKLSAENKGRVNQHPPELKSRRDFPRRLNTGVDQMITHLILLLLILVILDRKVKITIERK
jgi:hypothetical protein